MTEVREILAERGKAHGDFGEHARITQNHRDHWDDIAGYATLAADRVKGEC